MKIQVVKPNGEQVALNLSDRVIVQHGVRLNRLVDIDGTEQFFDKDGYYDGWGMAASCDAPERTPDE